MRLCLHVMHIVKKYNALNPMLARHTEIQLLKALCSAAFGGGVTINITG